MHLWLQRRPVASAIGLCLTFLFVADAARRSISRQPVDRRDWVLLLAGLATAWSIVAVVLLITGRMVKLKVGGATPALISMVTLAYACVPDTLAVAAAELGAAVWWLWVGAAVSCLLVITWAAWTRRAAPQQHAGLDR